MRGAARRKVWVHKTNSWKEANEFETRYYSAMSRQERLDTMQLLREMAQRFGKGRPHGHHRKGLRRVVTVLQ